MSPVLHAYTGAALFDGRELAADRALLVTGARIRGIVPEARIPAGAERVELGGGLLAPGFVDLQVNGGGGAMFNADPSVGTLATIAQAHARLGTTTILPTLITDTPERGRAAIAAVAAAIAEGVAGIAGLHLEGPHLSSMRRGAHDPALIRPLQESDLALLMEAATRLPALMVTLAPESASEEQVRRLAGAGAVVSLGHSDADFETCRRYIAAGARCATHLFNAMSPLQARAPGLVGAVLQSGEISAGLIADAIHVHPAAIDIALRAKRGPGGLFLVSDAMATAGSALDGFELNGRRVSRREGRLTLEDGTLAGADLEIAAALRLLVKQIGIGPGQALTMAGSRPAELVGLAPEVGNLRPGARADFVHLGPDLELLSVWQSGRRLGG